MPSFTNSLEKALHKALTYANERSQEYATLEHLLLALVDDEDAGTLAYLSRKVGARTMIFSLTRGEGGANLISSHFFDALGVLRTLEFKKACEYYGAELFYANRWL